MSSPSIPNNLGPLLLITLSLPLLPLGIGIPLLLLALARVRTIQGGPAWPSLHRWLSASAPWSAGRSGLGRL